MTGFGPERQWQCTDASAIKSPRPSAAIAYAAAPLVVGKVGRIGIMRGRQLRRPLNALEMMCALLRHALDRESMEFRILVANLPGFLERR